MDFLGVGPLELIVVLILALILFGPERLPEMAARAGRTIRQLRDISQAFTEEFQREVAQAQELKETTEVLQREVDALRKEAGALRGELVEGPIGSLEAARDELEHPLRGEEAGRKPPEPGDSIPAKGGETGGKPEEREEPIPARDEQARGKPEERGEPIPASDEDVGGKPEEESIPASDEGVGGRPEEESTPAKGEEGQAGAEPLAESRSEGSRPEGQDDDRSDRS